jgi:hypothetical protein
MEIKINTYIFCFIAGLIGILFHICLKIPEMKKRFKVANIEFSLSKYFQDDMWGIIASIVTVIAAIFILDEIVDFYPALLKWSKFFFIFIGYTGSSLLVTALGKTADYVNKIVDVKTDVADLVDK